MFQLLLFLLLNSASYQTDIDLPPFEEIADGNVTIKENVTVVENTTVVSIPETTTKRALTASEDCLLTLNITGDNLTEGVSNIVFGDYLSCLWKRKKLLDDNGNVNFTFLEETLRYSIKLCADTTNIPLLNTKYLASEIMEQCKNINVTTLGLKALRMRNCLYGSLLYQRKENEATRDFEDIAYLEIEEETCVIQLKLNALEIEDLNRRYLVSENATDFQSFLECYWTEIEFMDKNGTFNATLLQAKFIDDIEFELLSRSRAPYLTDILTKSILNGLKKISGKTDGELIFNVHNYIKKRLPYLRLVLQY